MGCIAALTMGLCGSTMPWRAIIYRTSTSAIHAADRYKSEAHPLESMCGALADIFGVNRYLGCRQSTGTYIHCRTVKIC